MSHLSIGNQVNIPESGYDLIHNNFDGNVILELRENNC